MLVTTSIAKDIVRIRATSQHELSETFLRFQEHYESPEWRGKIFTVGQFRAWYSREHGANTYERDWSGYNIPSYVLEPFVRGLFDPLTPAENALVNLFRFRDGRFYIIGSQDDDTLDHEECHALYYVSEAYRAAVDAVLGRHAAELAPVERCVRRMMYHPSVVPDEVHAYVSEGDEDWFLENRLEFPKRVHAKLRALKAAHMKRTK